MSTQAGKDVIYIDIDDEITAIIDKVRGSKERIVALVLPKRATVLQSIVNMKLLKRTADEAKKQVVLITSEAGLLPLAGTVGIYVAKSLQSKPEVPSVPTSRDRAVDEDSEETVAMADDEELDASRPVGEHLRKATPSVAVPTALADEADEAPIELDNTVPATPAAAALAKAKAASKKGGFKVPDFNKFRLWLALGALGLVLLIFVWYMAFVSMPRATIAIKTDSTAVERTLDVTLDSEADEVETDTATVPAEVQQVQKTLSQEVEATGQKDEGTKATGTIRFYNCSLNDLIAGNDRTIPAGTGVSTNGLTFITQETVIVPPSNFSGNNCKNNKPSAPVEMTAQSVGEKYNIGAANYTVAGYSTITGQGSATSGGSSKIIKVVSQSDIDNAKQKISSQDTNAVKQELAKGLTSKGLFAIDATFKANDPEVSTNVKVGEEADKVTVTQKITYTMVGAEQSALKKVITESVKDKIDLSKQEILDYGLDSAVFKLQNQQNSQTLVTMALTVIAGSDLNLNEIKKQVAGKKSNDAKQVIGDYPGVTEVTVDYSPFWVSAIPKKTSKIKVTVEKPIVKDANER